MQPSKLKLQRKTLILALGEGGVAGLSSQAKPNLYQQWVHVVQGAHVELVTKQIKV